MARAVKRCGIAATIVALAIGASGLTVDARAPVAPPGNADSDDGAVAEPTRTVEPAAEPALLPPVSQEPQAFRGYLRESPQYTNIGYGPLHLTSQSPFQSLRLGITPRPPTSIRRGQFELRAGSTWANVWSQGDGYFLDYEMLQTSVSVAYGMTERVELELELENRSRFGGELDSLSHWFHDTMGIRQNGRDEVPKDQFTFELTPEGSDTIALSRSDKGVFSQSALLTVQHNTTLGNGWLPALSYAVTARFDAGGADELVGVGNWDVGLSVAVARRFGNFYAYGTLGAARFASDEFRGLKLRRTQVSLLGAVEWRYFDRQSLLFQYLVSEGQVHDFDPFSEPSHELTLGWKWEALPGSIVEFGLIENAVGFDNTPDVGFQLGFSQRF
jgi:hypothetical protein